MITGTSTTCTWVANIFNHNPKLLATMSEVYVKYNSQQEEARTRIRATYQILFEEKLFY